MEPQRFNIHGDNIVECVRAFDYIVAGLGDLVVQQTGPTLSVTCPAYTVRLADRELVFRFLPGYGPARWNQDVLGFVKRSGGRLREAADALVTRLTGEVEQPVFAIEFCGALPAGNNAWQRQGRAFSFAHARIPYFFVAELGGFELDAERVRKSERMPNAAVPFSFLAMTLYRKSVCLPVYEANTGATGDTIARYGAVFGKADFLQFLKLAVLGQDTAAPAAALREKCLALVKLLADGKTRRDGLTAAQWQQAYDAVAAGDGLLDALGKIPRLAWSKTTSIDLTTSARQFMAMGAVATAGLTSTGLPLSFTPKAERAAFARKVQALYPKAGAPFLAWLATTGRPLAIVWLNGFKPRGDDARPDRGLAPLARMLVGDDCDLLTFVYGPAPALHWKALAEAPATLAARNGLWEAVLGVSDAVLVDSVTAPPATRCGHLKSAWAATLAANPTPLRVEPAVLSLGEQDVDTALHVAFEALGPSVAFEGMCNPPGGDWSGISFRWEEGEPEHRWLTLPRVSAEGAKRPDHVFALFGHGTDAVCLCIESKERARALEPDIGPRLKQYAQALFAGSPSISRGQKAEPWTVYEIDWAPRTIRFVSAGAFRGQADDPFKGLPPGTALDLQIGVVFDDDGHRCTLHIRGETDAGRALAAHLRGLPRWSDLTRIRVQ